MSGCELPLACAVAWPALESQQPTCPHDRQTRTGPGAPHSAQTSPAGSAGSAGACEQSLFEMVVMAEVSPNSRESFGGRARGRVASLAAVHEFDEGANGVAAV